MFFTAPVFGVIIFEVFPDKNGSVHGDHPGYLTLVAVLSALVLVRVLSVISKKMEGIENRKKGIF